MSTIYDLHWLIFNHFFRLDVDFSLLRSDLFLFRRRLFQIWLPIFWAGRRLTTAELFLTDGNLSLLTVPYISQLCNVAAKNLADSTATGSAVAFLFLRIIGDLFRLDGDVS